MTNDKGAEHEKAIHTMPTHDIKEHEESLFCWCNPKQIAQGLIVHNVFSDAYPREERETQ